MSDVLPTAPSKPPPADDSCSVCYFSEENNGVWRCCYNPPGWQRSTTGYGTSGSTLINWPIVDADDWCGHGYNTTSAKWMTPDGVRA